jgi:spectinomycin phosphotransferase
LKVPPPDLSEAGVLTACGRWEPGMAELVHFPHGFGSHHWLADTSESKRFFVTVDDLDTKPWLGDDRDSVFAGLARCYETAHALPDGGGLSFVVAPLAAPGGEVVARLTDRYTLAMFPFVEGVAAGQWGEPSALVDPSDLVRALADLHAASRITRSHARREDLEIAGRSDLEDALVDRSASWEGGPFSELARECVREDGDLIRRSLARFDHLADVVRTEHAQHDPGVLTHGEPHPGNVIVGADGRLHLVDWDTVAIAAPERDLWMLAAEPGHESEWLSLYTSITGLRVSSAAIELYRLAWVLKDLVGFVGVLRAPHSRDPDMETYLRALSVSIEHLKQSGGAALPWVGTPSAPAVP